MFLVQIYFLSINDKNLNSEIETWDRSDSDSPNLRLYQW